MQSLAWPPNLLTGIYGFLIIHVAVRIHRVSTGLPTPRRLAFEWFERAFEERNGALIYISTQPYYDPLRDDRRFQDLRLRMNLEP